MIKNRDQMLVIGIMGKSLIARRSVCVIMRASDGGVGGVRTRIKALRESCTVQLYYDPGCHSGLVRACHRTDGAAHVKIQYLKHTARVGIHASGIP